MSAREENEGRICGTCVSQGKRSRPRAKMTRGRTCTICEKPICPEHVIIYRGGEGYTYTCVDCESNDNHCHRYSTLYEEQNHIMESAARRTRCARCKRNPIDQDNDDDLCERCRSQKCVHCLTYDLDQSFETYPCHKCRERVCEEHSEAVEPDRHDGCTLYIQCKECIDFDE